MTDAERIKRIEELWKDADIADDYTQDVLFAELEQESFANIKDIIWLLYCFAIDVFDTITMHRGDDGEE